MKAQIATINLGFTEFDGLMMPDGSYGIAVPQVALLIQSTPNYASQQFKRLMGEDFSPHKSSIEGTKAQVNTIDLRTFTKLLYALAKGGNPIADALVEALLEESFERRYDTAFNKKVSEAEYNAKLNLRFERLLARRGWTDILRDRHIQCFGKKPKPNQFRGWTVEVNEALFSRKHFNCNRDNMEEEQQRIIKSFEEMAVRRAKQYPNATPDELLALALDTF